MKVDSAKLAEGFQLIDSIPANTILESSQFVMFTANSGKLRLKLAGIASAQAEMPCEGDAKFLVDRRAMSAFLAHTKEHCTFENTDKGTLLRSGGSRLELAPPKEITGYSEWKAGQGQKLKLEGNLLGLLSEYAKANPGEPHLEVVCFSKGYGAFATDTLVVAACLDKTIAAECLLPQFISNLAGKMNATELWVEKNGAAIRNATGWVYQPLPASEAAYPKDQVKGVLDAIRKQSGFLTVSATALYAAMQPLQNYAWASDGSLTVQCIPAKKLTDVLRLRLDMPAVKAEFTVSVKVTGKMPEKWSWPLSRVLPWLEHVKTLENSKVTIGMHEHLRFFKCVEGDKLHCLVVAGMD